jgi:hypothetical protein
MAVLDRVRRLRYSAACCEPAQRGADQPSLSGPGWMVAQTLAEGPEHLDCIMSPSFLPHRNAPPSALHVIGREDDDSIVVFTHVL